MNQQPAVPGINGPGVTDAVRKDGDGAAPHLMLLLCILMFAAFGAWTWFARLDIVSVAIGVVTPSSQVKSIAHLEGGIVSQILVVEGDAVSKGQPLVELEAISSSADVDEIEVRLTSLRIEIARLDAEANGKETLSYPEELVEAHPKRVNESRKLFKVRRNSFLSRIAGQREIVRQREEQEREIRVRLKNSHSSLELINEQIAISEDLLRDNLTNRYNHLELLREHTALKSRTEEDTASVSAAGAALREAKNMLAQIEHGFLAEAREKLVEARREYNEFSQRLKKFEDKQRRTVLRAPVDGVVKTLHVYTVGGVVGPGETVIDIVPGEDKLIIEAQLPTQDIGYVRIDQEAVIRLNSADLVRFGKLDGRVVNISPDTLIREDGLPYYKVSIETDKSYFEKDDLRYNLFPGMQVVASILTGQRTVLEYVLEPFLGRAGEALRER